jgi:hypothetical protein
MFEVHPYCQYDSTPFAERDQDRVRTDDHWGATKVQQMIKGKPVKGSLQIRDLSKQAILNPSKQRLLEVFGQFVTSRASSGPIVVVPAPSSKAVVGSATKTLEIALAVAQVRHSFRLVDGGRRCASVRPRDVFSARGGRYPRR